MGPHFRSNVRLSAGFFVVRFIVSISVALSYLIVAAGIQYAVVGLLGETTFNYIVGGLLSLFLGAIICDRVGALIFMFVRGWHVAALAYATKIRRSGAPAVTVGMKAFAKNIVGFGAVYGVRTIAKNLLADFKDKLWDLLSEVPLAQNLQQVAENPIVEHLATDVLNYGFDATIFYLIKHPTEDLNDVPSVVLEGLKRYLYCLPSIMLTSISSYILFRFLPKLCKWLLILWVLFTQGFCAGILITVLMWPVFYILENTFFVPLTMIMFISCFSKEYDNEVDENSPVVQMVNAVLDGESIGTTSDDLDDEEGQEPEPEEKPRRRRQPTPEPEEAEAEPEAPPVPSPSTTGQPTLSSGWREMFEDAGSQPMVREDPDSLWDDIGLVDDGEGEDQLPPEPAPAPAGANEYDDMLRRFAQSGGVQFPPMGGPGGATGTIADILNGLDQTQLGKALDGDDTTLGGDF